MDSGAGVISLWWVTGLTAALFLALGWIGYWFFARPVAQTFGRTSMPKREWGYVRKGSLNAWAKAVALGQVVRAGGWRPLLALLVVVFIAIGAVYAMGGLIRVDPLGVSPGHFGARIGQAFAPEELAPPPSLPPTLFVSPEDPGLETADRDWAKLDARFRQAVLWLIERARQRGVLLVLLEGYRSPERQERLASQGRNVTRAGAFQSKHQFGLAADLVPMRDGKLAMSEAEPWAAEAYRVIGEEAAPLGLVWGGSWTLRDLGHVEVAGAMVARHQQ